MAALKPAAPPDPGNGFDVSPPHLYYTSYLLRNQQYDFSEGPVRLLSLLDEHAHAGGRGSGPEAFAAVYATVSKRFTEVWARAVVGVGGAAVGLTVTANNYVRAEYHSDPKLAPALRLTPEPDVIQTSSPYWPVAELGWGHGSRDAFGDRIISDVLAVAGSFAQDVLLPVLRDALRHGKVADITPGGDDLALPKIAAAWTAAAKDAVAAGDAFDGAIAYITNPASGHSEWQDAMKQFCGSIWGTTAWGKDREGQRWNHSAGQKPVLGVLEETARALADACTRFGAAVATARSVLTDVYRESAYKTIKVNDFGDILETVLGGGVFELAVEFINNLDTGRLDRAVDTYNVTISELAHSLNALLGPLDEAFLSVPLFAAEEARAESVGSRALEEFREDHGWTEPGSMARHTFPLNLASEEFLHGGHTLDKHVGKSDSQLAQRLRDQGGPATDTWRFGRPSIGGASSFKNAAEAQEFTQNNLDQKSAEIQAWLSRPPADGDKEAFESIAPDNRVTGRSVTKQPVPGEQQTGFRDHGLSARALETRKTRTVLRYDPNLNPPFTVLTSMPSV
ncbi:RNase A-like domain-containing protein [Streptomyces sp. NPDC006711]|uniref:RNase A-like domain-containing protein n=1 Tax=Streptomyces sp. NPDC006711 TaxID=3364762 RepID=UPI00369A0498